MLIQPAKKFLANKKFVWFAYGFLSLVIILPLLKPGYVFALDMVWAPHLHLPTEITASYPFYALLWTLNFVLPSQIIQKLVLFGIFLLCGVGAHKTAELLLQKQKIKNRLAPFYAGLLYTINPFTYDRLMDGQFLVLLGYALLPFFAIGLWKLYEKPNLQNSLKLAGWALAISAVSMHAIGYMVVLTLALVIVLGWQNRRDLRTLLPFIRYGTISLGFALLISSYWLVPMLNGTSSRTELIGHFDERHLLSFRSVGHTNFSRLGNLGGLYGYWGEREGRFTVANTYLLYWPFLAIAIAGLAGYGLWKNKRNQLVLALGIAGLVAIVLAAGITTAPFNVFNRFLYHYLPFYRGFREPQKFISLLALSYAVLGSLGLAALITHPKVKKWQPGSRQALLALVLMLPIMYTPVMPLAGLGQLHANNYPAGWYAAKTYLDNSPHQKILFLPWNLYMHMDFAGKTIANPGKPFFGRELITSDDAGLGLIANQSFDPFSQKMTGWLEMRNQLTNFGEQLKPDSISDIILVKESAWTEYDFLNHQNGLEKAYVNDDLIIYKVK